MLDLFLSEYKWSIEYINFSLRMDTEAKLFHAILCRHGFKVRKLYVESDAIDFDLNKELNKELNIKDDVFDTDTILDGLTF